MTALPGRRRRSTLVAAVAAAVAIVLVVVLTIIGALTLYNSTDGNEASAARDELVFPQTPIGVLAAVDAEGKLASLAVFVVQPAGSGGSIVTVPVSADSSGGSGEDRLPLDETLAVQGEDAFRNELGAALRLGIDDVAVVDAGTLADILAPVGPLEVDLPIDVTDAAGEVVATGGATQMDATAAAAVLTARDPAVPAAEQYPAASAVWSAVAQAVGGGITVPPPATTNSSSTGTVSSVPASAGTVEELFRQLVAGRVGVRGLRTTAVPSAQNPRRVDVTAIDPAEVILVFGQIAPGAVSAPGNGLSFRIVSAFSDEQLAGSGLTNVEVAYRAIATILSLGGNVVSVATTGTPPGAASVLAVSESSMLEGAKQVEGSLGKLSVAVDDTPIAGVDVVATLGTAAIDVLAEAAATTGPGATTEVTDG